MYLSHQQFPASFCHFIHLIKKRNVHIEKDNKKDPYIRVKARQCAIFTGAWPTIVAAEVLNFCVRYGYRCLHFAFITGSFWGYPSKPNNSLSCLSSWLSPRPISINLLHTSLCFHTWPIYLVVFKGSYFLRMGDLILEGASRLDAFSAYPFPT